MCIEKNLSYYRTINNTNNKTVQQAEIDYMKSDFKYDFDSNISCKDVLINGYPHKVIYYVDVDNVVGGKSYKIKIKPGEKLYVGDILKIDEETWFVTEIMKDKMLTITGTLTKSVFTLKFYKNDIYREIPCAIVVGTKNYINSHLNKFIRYSTSKFTVYCPDLGYLTRLEDMGRRFIINGLCYNIESIENLTERDTIGGLIVLELNDDKVSPYDNFELGIADYYKNKSVDDDTDSTDKTSDPDIIIKICPNDTCIPLGQSLTLNCSAVGYEGNINCEILNIEELDSSVKLIPVNKNIYSITVGTKGKLVGKKIIFRASLNENKNIFTERVITITRLV